MFQANLPPKYWGEALLTTTYLINRLPSLALQFNTPLFMLYGTQPTYDHLELLVAFAMHLF